MTEADAPTRHQDPEAGAAFEALRALAGPFFDALARSGVAIIVTNPRRADDPIVYVNAAFETLTGYSANAANGRNCRFLQDPAADQQVASRLAETLEKDGAGTADLLNRRHDGSSFWNRLSITTLADAGGAPLYRLATLADVTGEYADEVVVEQLRVSRQRLAEAQERLRVAQSIAGAAGAWEWDIAGGVLVADVRFANLYGLDPVAAARGLPTSAFFAPVHADDRLRLKIAVAGALHGAEVFTRDYRVTRDGAVHWVSARGRTYLDAEDRPVRFSGVLADITDQKRVEERLLVAQTAGGVGSFEYLSGYGTAEVSEQFCRLLGLQPASSLPVRTINALVHADDPLIVQGRDGQHAVGPTYQELRIHRADTGEQRWLASRGEYRPHGTGGVSFIGVVYDITSTKRSEEQLRMLTETLEVRVAARTEERDRIWNLSRDLLHVIGPDGLYRAANPAWKILLGYEPADLVGIPAGSLVHPDDQQIAMNHFATLSRGEATGAFDCRMRTKDGTYLWVNWTAMPEGDTIYGIGRDVTQRKALEDQLRQSQKMEAVGQLTGGLAHDFNNMLTGILGGIDMVRRRLAEGRIADVDRFLDAAMQSGQRAAALTHRLLAFSRRQTLDNRALDVGTLAVSMEDLLRRTLGEQVSLRIDIAPDLWPAVADDNQLESAILNLGINARDAMPDGGELIIAARNVHLTDQELANSDHAAAGDYVAISVTDTGTGMPPEVLQKVFDPFYTTKPLGQGTGLGLSMIYGFVQQSRGHVVIDSQEGRGTTIQLFLPRHQGAMETPALIDDAFAPAGAGETVLVIEDDPAVRLLVMQVLEELGYRGIETADGRQAVPVLESSRHIDLLISDVGLPGLNGRQLAEIARERRPDLPILFMTGYAKQAADQAAFLDGGMEIISKPFAIDHLGRRIGEILGRNTA